METTWDIILNGMLAQGPIVTLLGLAIYWFKNQLEKKEAIINQLYTQIINTNKETIQEISDISNEIARLVDEIKQIKQILNK